MDQQPLSRQELSTLLQLITVCSSRGAFQPGEFIPVGQLFQRLTALHENYDIDDICTPDMDIPPPPPSNPKEQQLELNLTY